MSVDRARHQVVEAFGASHITRTLAGPSIAMRLAAWQFAPASERFDTAMNASSMLGKRFAWQFRIFLAMVGVVLFSVEEIRAQAPPSQTEAKTKVGNQLLISEAHEKRLKDADSELNAVFRTVLERAPSNEARERLRAAQRAWITLRDANAAFEGLTAADPKSRTSRLVSDTAARTTFLTLLSRAERLRGDVDESALTRVDRELNVTYKAALAGLAKMAGESLRKSQRAWLAVRDVDLALLTTFGVIRSPNEKWEFLRSATEQRTAFLQQAAASRTIASGPQALTPEVGLSSSSPTPNVTALPLPLASPIAGTMPDSEPGPGPSEAAVGQERWIPLPSYRNDVWSFPRSSGKRSKLRADYVGMAGNDGYLVVRQNDSVLMTSAGREALVAKQFFELGRDRLAFRLEDGGAFGVVTSGGRILHPPRLTYKEVDQMRVRSASQPELKTAAVESSLGTVGGAKVAIFSNSHPLAFPVAMDYNPTSGLLAAVENVGSSEMGSEVRVWDVHSRCCVFSKRLSAAPMRPVDVRISNSGLLFVSGGYTKFSAAYIEIFDLKKRALLHYFDLECGRLSNLQLVPLGDGSEFISQSRPLASGADETSNLPR